MGWLIALTILLGLAILPVGVVVLYDQKGPLIRLAVGPARFQLFPQRKKEQQKELKKKDSKKKKGSAERKPSKKKGGGLKDFLPMLDVILELLCKFRRKIRVNRLEMTLTLAGGDPCDLALNYAKAWAALGNLMPLLERFFIIKKRDLEVACDFTAEQTQIYARMDLSITVGRGVGLIAVYGVRLLDEYRKIMKIRKGGAGT